MNNELVMLERADAAAKQEIESLEKAAWAATDEYDNAPSIDKLFAARRAYIVYAEAVLKHARLGGLINGHQCPFAQYAEACLSEMKA